MEYGIAAGVQVDRSDVASLINACEYASAKLVQILRSLQIHGAVPQEWARDAVSLDIATYYNQQLFAGRDCTYSTLKAYQVELLSTIDALRRTLADYESVDGTAAYSLEQL